MPASSDLRQLPQAPDRTTPPAMDESSLLTVDEVAALLKVSKSWVYEHTRRHGARASGLPFVKIGSMSARCARSSTLACGGRDRRQSALLASPWRNGTRCDCRCTDTRSRRR